MDIIEKIYAALINSELLTSKLAGGKNGIYPRKSPDAGSYPIVVYSLINDTPAEFADDKEISKRVSIQIFIITANGNYEEISKIVNKIMIDLDFVRQQSFEHCQDNTYIKTIRYSILLQSEEE